MRKRARRRQGRARRLKEALRRRRAKLAPVLRKVAANTPETTGLHWVAAYEAFKGVIVLVAGFGLLALVHRDAQEVAEEFVRFLHLNPASHYPSILIDAASRVTDSGLRNLALLALLYAAVRLVEAFGLWHGKAWAEWFAIVTGALYLPVEIYEIVRHATVVKALVFAGNVAIVVYLVRARRRVAAHMQSEAATP